MINLFLRAKHWQLFIATTGLALLFQIVFMANIFASLIQKHDPVVILSYLKFMPVIVILSTGSLFAWQWSVVMGLRKMLPAGVTLKVTQFKIFFFIPLIYLVLIFTFVFVLLGGFITGMMTHSTPPDPAMFFLGFAFIIPVHLFSMFCIFYCIYFAAKTLKTVELQRAVTFSDFIGEFFLFWFHFVGVWILQPKINKLAEQYAEGEQNAETDTTTGDI